MGRRRPSTCPSARTARCAKADKSGLCGLQGDASDLADREPGDIVQVRCGANPVPGRKSMTRKNVAHLLAHVREIEGSGRKPLPVRTVLGLLSDMPANPIGSPMSMGIPNTAVRCPAAIGTTGMLPCSGPRTSYPPHRPAPFFTVLTALNMTKSPPRVPVGLLDFLCYST